MARISPWHSSRSTNYHVCTRCSEGRGIDVFLRILGTGGKPLCDNCRQLIQTGKC